MCDMNIFLLLKYSIDVICASSWFCSLCLQIWYSMWNWPLLEFPVCESQFLNSRVVRYKIIKMDCAKRMYFYVARSLRLDLVTWLILIRFVWKILEINFYFASAYPCLPNWSMSFSPGKSGELLMSSPNIQPTAQRSTPSVYLRAP